MLTDDQKRTQLDISRYLPSHYKDDPGNFIEPVVTQTETWVHHFDPESKMQSKHWKQPGSPLPKKCKRVHSAGKVMTSIFSDSQGVIMIDYLEQGRAINGAYYAGELRWLRQEISRKRQGTLTCGVQRKLLVKGRDSVPPPPRQRDYYLYEMVSGRSVQSLAIDQAIVPIWSSR